MDGVERIYIVDFVDQLNNLLFEIKPKEHLTNKKVKAKEISAKDWCEKNNFTFKIISQEYFIKNIDKIRKSCLSVKIKNTMEKLYEINKKNSS